MLNKSEKLTPLIARKRIKDLIDECDTLSRQLSVAGLPSGFGSGVDVRVMEAAGALAACAVGMEAALKRLSR